MLESISAVLKGGDGSYPLLKSVVGLKVSHSEARVLSVEKLAHSECMAVGLVELKLVEQESVVVLLEEIDLDICVPVAH